MNILLFIVLTFHAKKVFCFNFDLDFPILFEDPEPKEWKTYFGYTVAMYSKDRMNKWIKIGAPKANDKNYSNIERPGIVYNCEFNSECKPISFPQSTEKLKRSWEHGWVGGTMDVSYNFERIVVCGFRQYYIVSADYRSMGACFWSPLNTTKFENIKLLNPDNGLASYNSVSLYLYGQGEAGFSLHLPKHVNELIVGAPGVYNWAGTPFKLTDEYYVKPDSSRRRRGTSILPFRDATIPKLPASLAYSLFGYSVSSGYYRGGSRLYYASGAPKSNDYNGMVHIFTFNKNNQDLSKVEKKIGETLGEYFGASLASGYLNGDSYEDLLVGAPFYKGNSYNEGRVYVFLGEKSTLRRSAILSSEHINGQFGTAIMFLEDIDSDGYGEVAIGAPYENERTGNVYIYTGTTNGLRAKPCQVIEGKDIFPEILGFGISLSKPVDIDDNKHRDITIGAHVSGHAVLLRSRPLVIIKYTFESNPAILPESTTAFNIKICFSFSLCNEKSVNITYSLTVDEQHRRALIGSDIKRTANITIIQNDITCINIPVNITNATVLNIKEPLKALLTYDLNYHVTGKSVVKYNGGKEDGDQLCLRCPILDGRSNQTFYETEIPFSLDCGPDNICHSSLEVRIDFPTLSENKLVIGSSQYLKMKAAVSNFHENAYSTKLYVVLQNSIYFRQTPPKCTSLNASSLVCDMPNPLRNNSMKTIDFDIDVGTVATQLMNIDHLEIFSEVVTSSNNTNKQEHVTSLELITEANVTISGKSEQESNYYGITQNSTSLLTHSFTVEKFGVSPLERMSVAIQIPHTYQVLKEPVIFLTISSIEAFFNEQPLTCDTGNVLVNNNVELYNAVQFNQEMWEVEKFKNISSGKQYEELTNDNGEIINISDKILYLNCSTLGISCFNILCSFGPYDKKSIPASIVINMIVNITEIAGKKSRVVISTSGHVTVDSPKNFRQQNHSADSVVVSSLFFNDTTKAEKVSLWIIIVAVIIGLLLLLILTVVLLKLGFFKRSKKEELENMKAAANQEAKILEIIEVSREQEDASQEQEPTDSGTEQIHSSKESLCHTK